MFPDQNLFESLDISCSSKDKICRKHACNQGKHLCCKVCGSTCLQSWKTLVCEKYVSLETRQAWFSTEPSVRATEN